MYRVLREQTDGELRPVTRHADLQDALDRAAAIHHDEGASCCVERLSDGRLWSSLDQEWIVPGGDREFPPVLQGDGSVEYQGRCPHGRL